jgi:hypothetical protein
MTREIGDHGQCEAHDLIPTEDDAIDVRCPRPGRCIRETDEFGRARLRFVCVEHGLASAMEVN